MKKMIAALVLLSQLNQTRAQSRNDWFVGMDIGNNQISSFYSDQPDYSKGAIGIWAEYFINQKWSLVGQLKQYDIGVTTSSSKGYMYFKGSVLTLPVTVKNELRVAGPVKFFTLIGLAYHIETQREYLFYDKNETDYDAQYFSIATGMGFSCYFHPKWALFGMVEHYWLAGAKGKQSGWFGDKTYYTSNFISSIGIKYSLNSKKNKR